MAGWFHDVGQLSDLKVTINWGDGSRDSQCISPQSTCFNIVGSPLQLVRSDNQSPYGFRAQHTYGAPGTYYGTVWVNDPLGGSDSETFVITVSRLAQAINFAPLPLQSYGAAPLAISATGGASGLPVTFAVTGNPSVCALSGASSSGATASATVTVLEAGKCIITAQQAGNDQYDAARGVTQSFDILPVPLTVKASSATMVYGAALPAITPSYDGFVNADSASSLDMQPTCSAAATSEASAGTYQTTCAGAVDPSYGFDYVPGELTIKRAVTTLALVSVPASAVKGQPVTFTASVAVTSPGSGYPGGTVDFKDGATTIGGCAAQQVNATTRAATCTTSALSVGAHSITASYSGDGNFIESATVSAITKMVSKASTTTTVRMSANPSISGKSVTFTATVAVAEPGAGSPSGSVTFFDGATRLATGSLTVVDGKVQSTFSTSSLAVGRHSIMATYSGDSDFTTSMSAASSFYVNTDLSGYPTQPSGTFDLTGVNLRGASLVGVSLVGARLNTVNLESAVLIGADLTGATVVGTNFTGANLTNSVLKDAKLSDSTFKTVNFTGTNLTGATFEQFNPEGRDRAEHGDTHRGRLDPGDVSGRHQHCREWRDLRGPMVARSQLADDRPGLHRSGGQAASASESLRIKVRTSGTRFVEGPPGATAVSHRR